MSRFSLVDGIIIQDLKNLDSAWNLTAVKSIMTPSVNGEGISYLRKEEKNGVVFYNWQVFLPPPQSMNQPQYTMEEQKEFYHLALLGLRNVRVGQLFKEISISFPVAKPEENWKKAEELFDFMESKSALGAL